MMAYFEHLRVSKECGTVFTKLTADRIFLACPNCKSPRRCKIELEHLKELDRTTKEQSQEQLQQPTDN